MTISATPFVINHDLDLRDAAATYRQTGVVRLTPFLTSESVTALLRFAQDDVSWHTTFNAGSKVYELDRAARERLSGEQLRALEAGIVADARAGFQFYYDTMRVPDDAAQRAGLTSPVAAFAQFLSSPAVIELFRTVTGEDDIAFADAQLTCFRTGHFLTAHDDEVAGKGRRAAYTFGLSEHWRPEWGGLLLFHDDAGDISRGFSPAFNALTVFKVPQVHSVSSVAPTAPVPRLSITGWLRSSA